jgi:dihydropteroate synthase
MTTIFDTHKNKPIVMGILNVTPDSFSDGGRFDTIERAIARGREMIAQGADIIDIGGESTRPGSDPVDVSVEIERIRPVVKGLAGKGALISVDTRNAETMHDALLNGAGMINDISALTHDPKAIDVIGKFNPYVCLMHMQGDPSTMQMNPAYGDVTAEVYDFLKRRMAACEASGIDRSMILIDPGIGFGKTLDHNLNLLKNIGKLHELGARVMIGASRKRFIEGICPGAGVGDRLPGSLAAVLWARSQGVSVFRVHDVVETVQALKVWDCFY